MRTSPELEPQPTRGFPVALLVGVVLVAAMVAAGWFFFSQGSGGGGPQPLPFGPEEQEYAKRIRFHDFKLSRAENLLKQEVTFIECTMENSGTGTVHELEVVLEFHNVEDQLLQTATRRLLGPYAPPVGGGRFRKVDFNFETLPAEWNRHPPVVRITGLVFEP